MNSSTLAGLASACKKDIDAKAALVSSTANDVKNIASAMKTDVVTDLATAGKDSVNTMMKEGEAKLDAAGASYIEGAFDAAKRSALDIYMSVNAEFGPLALAGKMLAITPNFIEAPSACGYATGRATQELAKTVIQSTFFI